MGLCEHDMWYNSREEDLSVFFRKREPSTVRTEPNRRWSLWLDAEFVGRAVAFEVEVSL